MRPLTAALLTVSLWANLGLGLGLYGAEQYIATLERLSSNFEDKMDYFFNGANERGYLEICRNADDEVVVVYKDECS